MKTSQPTKTNTQLLLIAAVLFFAFVSEQAATAADPGQILIAQGSSGGSGSSSAGSSSAGGDIGPVAGPGAGTDNDITNSDKGGPIVIRKRYFLRFPYAKNAFNHDILKPVTDSSSSSGGGSSGGSGGGSGGGSSNDPNSPFESTGPGTIHVVNAYHFIQRYCREINGVPDVTSGLCYWQPQEDPDDVPKTHRDEELNENILTTFGYPLSDTQFQIIDRENKQRFLELFWDPERFMWLSLTTGQIQAQSLADSSGRGAQTTFGNTVTAVNDHDLINVANENAASPTASDNPNKTLSQAIWMVQQMYKYVFLPMAILFLLPGAILSQVQSLVNKGMLSSEGAMSMPFEGILRSMIAIFLIPATQLIVSYCIDIGNSMSDSVKSYIQQEVLLDWANLQAYLPPQGNAVNYIPKPNLPNTVFGLTAANSGQGGTGNDSSSSSVGSGSSGSSSSSSGGGGGGGGSGGFLAGLTSGIIGAAGGSSGSSAQNQGKAAQVAPSQTVPEREVWLSSIMQCGFNFAEHAFSMAVIVLTAYQVIMMCYLFLMGPISACFFAWPSLNQGGGTLFRNVWSKWLNSVITVALWRFYWCVLLAVMTQRIIWLQQTTGLNPNTQFECMVFLCFLGLMLYVPFQPFNFDPGQAMASSLSMGAQLGGQMSQSIGAAGQAAGIPAAEMSQMLQPLNTAVGQVGAVGGAMTADDSLHEEQMGRKMGGDESGPGSSSGSGGGEGSGSSGGSDSGGADSGGSSGGADSSGSSSGGGIPSGMAGEGLMSGSNYDAVMAQANNSGGGGGGGTTGGGGESGSQGGGGMHGHMSAPDQQQFNATNMITPVMSEGGGPQYSLMPNTTPQASPPAANTVPSAPGTTSTSAPQASAPENSTTTSPVATNTPTQEASSPKKENEGSKDQSIPPPRDDKPKDK